MWGDIVAFVVVMGLMILAMWLVWMAANGLSKPLYWKHQRPNDRKRKSARRRVR